MTVDGGPPRGAHTPPNPLGAYPPAASLATTVLGWKVPEAASPAADHGAGPLGGRAPARRGSGRADRPSFPGSGPRGWVIPGVRCREPAAVGSALLRRCGQTGWSGTRVGHRPPVCRGPRTSGPVSVPKQSSRGHGVEEDASRGHGERGRAAGRTPAGHAQARTGPGARAWGTLCRPGPGGLFCVDLSLGSSGPRRPGPGKLPSRRDTRASGCPLPGAGAAVVGKQSPSWGPREHGLPAGRALQEGHPARRSGPHGP